MRVAVNLRPIDSLVFTYDRPAKYRITYVRNPTRKWPNQLPMSLRCLYYYWEMLEWASRHFYRTSPIIILLLFSFPAFLHAHITSISRMTLGSKGVSVKAKVLPTLRDLDQPFSFNIRMYNRPYQFQFYDTASPTNYTLLQPSVIILCYSIANPESLTRIQSYWKKLVETHFNYDETLPVILLGLMRDLRQKEDYDGTVRPLDSGGVGESDVLNGRRVVYPQEGLGVAQEMRCDRYCECSALNGEVSSDPFLLVYHHMFALSLVKINADLFDSSVAKSSKISQKQPP